VSERFGASRAVTISSPALLGTAEYRVDGREKVAGQAQYSADLARKGMLWAAFVTSPYAHARIVRIDTTAARAMDGVHAVLTGNDIGERYMGRVLRDWPVLAYERVKFAGEYVAAVAADTPAIAAAAAAQIEVVYEELPALLDVEVALADGTPPLHPNETRYPYAAGTRPARPHPNMQGHEVVRKGDPEKAFAEADRVFEHAFRTPRYHAGYIEPRATLLWIDDGVMHVVCSNQAPFRAIDQLAGATGHPKERIVLEPSYIGGTFGAKAMMIEECTLYYLARATQRPIKYVSRHADDVRSTGARHGSTVRGRIATTRDGRIVAIDLHVLFDGGAYGAGKPQGNLVPGRPPKLPYAVPNLLLERAAVYTNTIPGGYLRAPGDLQVSFALESLMDIVASDLGIDPIALRMRNAATDDDTDLEGNPFAQPRPRELLAVLRDAMNWTTPPPAGRGRGVALTAQHFLGGTTSLAATAFPNGTIAVETGSMEPGVGMFTVIARVIAAELDIDPLRVSVRRGATDTVPFDHGMGGSRGTMLLGNAALDAARKLRAALALPHEGPVRVIGVGEYLIQPGDPVWLNFGAYGVEVSIDPQTGQPTLHDVVFVADCGTIINPIAHRGQIDGGFLMGLGSALTEGLQFEDGRIVNAALSDYKLPTMHDMPPFRVITLEPGNGPGPFGARGGGGVTTAGVAPTSANTPAAACGVRLDQLPLTAERIYMALQG
jgi:CO/xanthine dehydrogenase Mo-binding subunit